MKLIDEVLRIIEANPNVTYQYPEQEGSNTACYYTRGECSNGTVGCIMGQALVNLGCPVNLLESADEGYTVDNIDGPFLLSIVQLIDDFKKNKRFNLDDSPEEINLLGYIQIEQDSGATWEEALERARKEMEMIS